MARNGDVMRSDRLKQVMQEIDPNFDERTSGLQSFSKFVSRRASGAPSRQQAGQRAVRGVAAGRWHRRRRAGGRGDRVPPAPRGRGRPSGRRRRPRRERPPGTEPPGPRAWTRARAGWTRAADEAPREGAAAGREPSARREPVAPRGRTTDGTLSLARAFQLMTQALSELRAPSPHEALRLRMVALHGREDPLLEAARFTRLLRQANDAEIADVRKVGEDDYEVSSHRTSGVPAIAAPAPSAGALAAANTEELPVAGTAADAGVEPAGRSETASGRASASAAAPVRRSGAGRSRSSASCRWTRRRSRSARSPMLEEPAVESEPARRKPARPRAPRKKAAAAAATAPPKAGDEAEPAAPRAKRTRARAKKKAE